MALPALILHETNDIARRAHFILRKLLLLLAFRICATTVSNTNSLHPSSEILKKRVVSIHVIKTYKKPNRVKCILYEIINIILFKKQNKQLSHTRIHQNFQKTMMIDINIYIR